jgi:hypothetical protein
MEGNYPRLRLYLYSPAAQALAAAEKAFPVLEGTRELDPAPLMKAASFEFSHPELRPRRTVHAPLAFISLAMGSAALTVLWKGNRHD